MLELHPDKFSKILPLLSGIRQAVLPYAVCEGINPGRIFVNDLQNPTICLIWTTVGYFFLAGSPAGTPPLKALSHCLSRTLVPAARALGETGYILIASPGWENLLSHILPNRSLIHILRRTFRFDPRAFSALAIRQKKLPPEFSLTRMDETLAAKAGMQSSWPTPAAFVKNGIGFALLNGDTIVSTCTSVFASSQGVEMDVQTAEEFRGRGFATVTASALIEECLLQNKLPNWECFWDNQASTHLAEKLGFQVGEDYPVTYWEET